MLIIHYRRAIGVLQHTGHGSVLRQQAERRDHWQEQCQDQRSFVKHNFLKIKWLKESIGYMNSVYLVRY